MMMQNLLYYCKRIKNIKIRTELPYVGLVLYILMVLFLRLRWLRTSKSIGNFLVIRYIKNHAVNSVLATVFSQLWSPKAECEALMRIVRSGKNDEELLARTAESAVYAHDLESLFEVRNAATAHNPALLAYFDGLIAFFIMDANYAAYFQESVKLFLLSAGYEIKHVGLPAISVQIENYIESGGEIPAYVRQAYNILGPSTLDNIFSRRDSLPPRSWMQNSHERASHDMTSHSDMVILISCSYRYLIIFSDYFLKKLRLKNKNSIHFHVVSDDDELVCSHLNTLNRRYKNINYSIEPLARKSQTYITVVRFLICQEIMDIYKSDVLITDIDLTLDFDLSSMLRKINAQASDVAFFDSGYRLPWSKFAAGFSFFKHSSVATSTYLSILCKYLTSLYENGGFFSMDQTGIFQAYEYMQKRNIALNVMNLVEIVNFKQILTVPNRLNRQKIVFKWSDGGPQ